MNTQNQSFHKLMLAAMICVAMPITSHAALIGHYSFENDSTTLPGFNIYNDAIGAPDAVNGSSASGNSFMTNPVVDGTTGNTYRHWQTTAESSNLDYIQAGNNKMSGRTTATMSVWFNTSQSAGQVLLASTFYNLTMGLESGAGQLRTAFNATTGSWADPVFSSASTYADGEWHMATVVFDGTSTVTTSLYIDGVLENSVTDSGGGTGSINGSNEYIGAASNLTANFQGDMDEVRYYDTALNSTEIGTLYDSTKGLFAIPEPNTLALLSISGLVALAFRRRRC